MLGEKKKSMSCIATFYLIPSSKAQDVAEAKKNEKRIERKVEKKSFLFLSWNKISTHEVGDVNFDELLEFVRFEEFEYPYSGFLLVSFLWTYHQFENDQFFNPMDEYFFEIKESGAKEFIRYLEENPVGEEKLREHFEKESDSRSLEHFDESFELYETTERILKEWMEEVTDNYYGLLHLSY